MTDSALRAPIMTHICRFGWAGIFGMVGFPTLLNRGCSHPLIQTRWRMTLRDLTLPLWEGIRPSSFRSSRTGRIPRYSSRCTARTPSKSIPRRRSTNSSVRHSLHTNPRERSARSVRGRCIQIWDAPGKPIHALHIRGTREELHSAGRNVLRATPPRDTRHTSHHARERHPHHDRYANIGVPKNPGNPYYQQTDKESNPHGYNPHGTKYIDYGLGANPNPAPDGTRFYKMFRATFPSSVGSSRHRVCAAPKAALAGFR